MANLTSLTLLQYPLSAVRQVRLEATSLLLPSRNRSFAFHPPSSFWQKGLSRHHQSKGLKEPTSPPVSAHHNYRHGGIVKSIRACILGLGFFTAATASAGAARVGSLFDTSICCYAHSIGKPGARAFTSQPTLVVILASQRRFKTDPPRHIALKTIVRYEAGDRFLPPSEWNTCYLGRGSQRSRCNIYLDGCG